MTDLSRYVASAVSRYADAMELTAVPASDGSFGFDFEEMGRVSIVSAQSGEVLISLTRRLLLDGVQNLAQLAGLAGISDDDGQTIHAARNKYDQPVLVARLRQEDIDPTRIEGVLADLDGRFKSLGW
ncbi:hypothetical protein [Phaeobacter sp. HF9A]|uniref:hypothetical protein n=1 Tax=Phaeobacter sp. HF9A TaxID=2721561 RepID=UPI0014320126|nr:hypothetical protein [Phaeobacter sp. HF9A]NIZ12024.1 hypothetical protein [Phaeobacter sp. HF9A]